MPPARAFDRHFGFAAARRLTSPADFARVLRAPARQSMHAARRWVSVVASWHEAGSAPAGVRFGVTVGRRHARRAVDRALVKRILREASRHRAGAFEQCAAPDRRIDIVLRLRAPLIRNGQALAMSQWRLQIRRDADLLLEQLLARMTANR